MPSKIADYLPSFTTFLQQLTQDVNSEKITSWDDFETAINPFYTPEMMQKIESIAPGWIEMVSYRDGITQTHVTAVFVALMLSQEYQSATQKQRTLMEWAVLFHDISKISVKGSHDYIHAYKSAAVAGKALINLNFQTDVSQTEIDTWYDFTYEATYYSEEYNETIQDIEKLPQIIAGLKQIHNEDAHAIVLAILLHLAIVTDPVYPILAPMSEEHMKISITKYSLPIMKGLFLADGSGWELFAEDKSFDTQRRIEIERVFKKIEALIEF